MLHKTSKWLGILGFAALATLGGRAWALDKAVYYDAAYPTNWTSAAAATQIKDYFVGKGYTLVDAKALADFMKAHITSKAASVVVFAKDVYPDTVIDISSGVVVDTGNIAIDYMTAGGRTINTGDWPFYNIGKADGTNYNPAGSGSETILGIPGSVAQGDCKNDLKTNVTATDEGAKRGVIASWQTYRTQDPANVDVVLAVDNLGCPDGWIKNVGSGEFVRVIDQPFSSLSSAQLQMLQNLAEYSGTAFSFGTIKGNVKGATANTPVTISGTTTTAFGYTDASGNYTAIVPAGDYSVSVASELSAATPVKVTVANGATATADITSLTTLTDIDLSTDEGTGVWKGYGSLIGAPWGDFHFADPAFDDSTWADTEAPQAGKDLEGADLTNAWWGWYRTHIKLDASFPRDRYAVVWHYNYDDSDVAFFNGKVIGASEWQWELRRRYAVPKEMLKDDNVLAVMGYDGGGGAGFNEAPPHFHAGNPSFGVIQGQIMPVDAYGAANGVTVTATSKASGTAYSSPVTAPIGTYSIFDLLPGDYTISYSGTLVNAPSETVTVTAGNVITPKEVKAAPAILLSNQFIAPGKAGAYVRDQADQGIQGDRGKAFLAKDYGGTEPKDDQTALGLSESDYYPTSMQSNIRSNENVALAVQDNDWILYRIHFTPSNDFKTALGTGDLTLDQISIDHLADTNATVYFNGTKVGDIAGNGATSLDVKQSVLKFGEDNVLAIKFQAGNGMTDVNQFIRLRAATAGGTTPTVLKGDLNGDNKVNIADATMALQFAVGNGTPTAAQIAAGDVVGGDGKIGIPDVTKILQAAIGAITL